MSQKLFQSLDTEKRSLFVARQILDLISQGVLQVGDKLPTEKQICEETGVSRPCVREAIVALELLGIVERRAGAGTYIVNPIKAPSDTEVLSFLSLIFREGQTPLHLIEARLALEYGALQLGLDSPEPHEIDKLERVLQEMQLAAEARDARTYFRLDMEFHRGVIELVRNPIIQGIMHQLIEQTPKQEGWIEALERYTFGCPERIASSLAIHKKIVDALRAGEKDLLPQLLKEHYDQTPWLRGIHGTDPAAIHV